MSTQERPAFTGWRSFLWPIFTHEIARVVPLAIILFCVALSYSILRPLKDTLVITAAGAEILPFIKFWGIFPAAVGSTILFSFLLNRFRKVVVFQGFLLFFFIFFSVFCLYIYPHRELFHPHQSADFFETILPSGFRGLISMYRHYTLTIFYIIAELWGTLILQVIAWGIANEITSIAEAPRFYATMAVASNVAAFFAGQIGAFFSANSYNPSFYFGNNGWEQSLIKQMMVICALALVTMVTVWSLRGYFLDQNDSSATKKSFVKKQKKMGFLDSIICISKSRYLLNIAIMVIGYNLVINLVEVLWKDRLLQIYPEPGELNTYTNNLTSVMSVISTIGSLVMSKFIGRFGWTKTALVTPFVLLLTSGTFLGCLLDEKFVIPFIINVISVSPIFIAVTLGSVQNCFSKAAKYSVFDVTKEISFIPLDSEERIKGKAAIDGVGSRMAKSFGALIHQGLLLFCGSLVASTPYVGVIVLGIIGVWIWSVRSLGNDERLRGHTRKFQVATA